jgi:hypothetical protein
LALALLFGAGLPGPAGAAPFAAKNLEACDIVTFAASSSPAVAVSPERWQAYRDEVAAILGSAETPSAEALASINDRLLTAQRTLLATEIASSEPYQDYLRSDRCKLLTRLDSDAVDSLLDGLEGSVPKASLDVARAIASAASGQVTGINRSARFRSAADQALLNAQYYCFAAAAIHAVLPPEQQKTTGLAAFGSTMSCADAGRKD